jgi:hypothetical protein
MLSLTPIQSFHNQPQTKQLKMKIKIKIALIHKKLNTNIRNPGHSTDYKLKKSAKAQIDKFVNILKIGKC